MDSIEAAVMARSTNPFRYFDSSPEVIRLVVMMYVLYPLSLRNVEDLLFERGIDICHETVRLPSGSATQHESRDRLASA
jgi:transposase-like protein